MSTSISHDFVLNLPLSGVYLIEASAGTGKTFTLTAWVLRLVLETGIELPNILAVTFTRAATAELRVRIRKRLLIANYWLSDNPQSRLGSSEDEQTQAIIQHALAQGISPDTLLKRSQAALLQLDEASVFTIHGFCQRALHEFGFLAGILNQDQVIQSVNDIWQDVAADIWRQISTQYIEYFDQLCVLWRSPESLAGDLPLLCDDSRLLYPSAESNLAAELLHWIRHHARIQFEAALTQTHQRTFDQLIEYTWQASKNPEFLHALHQRWSVILLDEFQDTDPRQWHIFKAIFLGGIETDSRFSEVSLNTRVSPSSEVSPMQDSFFGAEISPSAENFPSSEIFPSPENSANTENIKPGLFLIGDPKQAIYRFRGGDLPTYLQAREFARQHGGENTLTMNFRSRAEVLRGIETIFRQNPIPFKERGIEFHSIQAASSISSDSISRNNQQVAGVNVHLLPATEDGKSRNKPIDEGICIQHTVDTIVDYLKHGFLVENGERRRVIPQDIAVLVRTNQEGVKIREALAIVGVIAATHGNQSVFASNAAIEILTLMYAMLSPADTGRVRAALATRLIGKTAEDIALLEEDADAFYQWQLQFENASLIWQNSGPLPALLGFLSQQAYSRLQEFDGARLMTDALHLAELLQSEAPLRQGQHSLLRWFAQHCESPPNDEALSLRLEADDEAVQITTLHKSKGLEYPIVFLPFTPFTSGGGTKTGVTICPLHNDEQQPVYYVYKTQGTGKDKEMVLGDLNHDQWIKKDELADQAEDLRLLYVGLTRAKYAVHLMWGFSKDAIKSPLNYLLHQNKNNLHNDNAELRDNLELRDYLELKDNNSLTNNTELKNNSAIPLNNKIKSSTKKTAKKSAKSSSDLSFLAIQQSIQSLVEISEGAIAVYPMSEEAPLTPLWGGDISTYRTPPESKQAIRTLRGHYAQYSFSGLRAPHNSEVAPSRGADDEAPELPLEEELILRGADFGNAVHDSLEQTQFLLWKGQTNIPESEIELLQKKLIRWSLPNTESALKQVGNLVMRALNAPLPGIDCLASLPEKYRVSEMEFHFRLSPTRLSDLFKLLENYGYPRQHINNVKKGDIEGFMHGYIDMVYMDQAQRYYILDYKTNQLRSYENDHLKTAIQNNDYDLQYLIYLVALHRWLRGRLGENYQPEHHLGGAVYLFLRGIRLENENLPAAIGLKQYFADDQLPDDVNNVVSKNNDSNYKPAAGIFYDQPPTELIEAMDYLFEH